MSVYIYKNLQTKSQFKSFLGKIITYEVKYLLSYFKLKDI